MEFHYVQPEDWPSDSYKTEGLAGSRAAGPIYAAWAVLKFLGERGYMNRAQKTMNSKQRLIDGIKAIDGLTPWDNELVPLVFGSEKVDIEVVVAGLLDRGWVPFASHEPKLIQLPLDATTDDKVIDTLLADLRDVVERGESGELTEKGSLRYT